MSGSPGGRARRSAPPATTRDWREAREPGGNSGRGRLVIGDELAPEALVLDDHQVALDPALTGQSKARFGGMGWDPQAHALAARWFRHRSVELHGARSTGAEALAVEPARVAVVWALAGA